MNKPLDFYVKWSASILSLVHVFLVAHDVSSLYKFTGITVALLWLLLGILWREPSMWILNVTMVGIYITGIFK
jgi:hypothetical protein